MKTYPDVDYTYFLNGIMHHMGKMTEEDLYEKGDIAIQLALRDKYIKSLELLLKHYNLSNERMGLCPSKVIGGDNAYNERSEYMKGWNDCNKAFTKKLKSRSFLQERVTAYSNMLKGK